MFFEYALEPALLSNWRDYCRFVALFGFSRGRLISRYPSTWKKMVIEAARRGNEIEFQRIMESLRNIDTLLLPRLHEWDKNKAWLPNAIIEQKKRPFRGIV